MFSFILMLKFYERFFFFFGSLHKPGPVASAGRFADVVLFVSLMDCSSGLRPIREEKKPLFCFIIC